MVTAAPTANNVTAMAELVGETKQGELPGGNIITVAAKRFHCAEVLSSDFKENLESEVVFWFDVARAHDHSLLPVERYWQPSWLITFTFFRTQEAPRSYEEDLGTEVVFWFDAGRTATACKTDVYLFPIQLDEKVAVLHLPASSRQG